MAKSPFFPMLNSDFSMSNPTFLLVNTPFFVGYAMAIRLAQRFRFFRGGGGPWWRGKGASGMGF